MQRFDGEVVSLFNNKVVQIYDKLRIKKEADNFIFIPQGRDWDNGKFTIDPDFRNIDNHRVGLIVNSKTNQAVSDTFSILLNYKHDYRLNLYGRSGYSGHNGSDGSDGSARYHGGNGGHITLFFTDDARPFQNLISASSNGESGGKMVVVVMAAAEERWQW
ncbi:hypothetical protein [uncultured Sunxiuqinia sp.]|uniref:hypothetical protein n=1 Tax=uncultured Sunxiuqinia sp. TaxID=1573825 RepID=UPI002AA75BF6|nr:hypothetical protein [uncultured Sunxiuqinia sp.]